MEEQAEKLFAPGDGITLDASEMGLPICITTIFLS